MKKGLVCLLGLMVSLNSFSQRKLTVVADKPLASVAPTMWGVFFEDINFGADGGLYAELVKNRGFEFPDALMGWRRPESQEGSALVLDKSPFDSANPHYLRIISRVDSGFSITNEGFRGIGVQAGENYDFSVQIRAVDGKPVL